MSEAYTMPMKRKQSLALVIMTALLLSAFTCSTQTKRLATASDAIAHALLNAQTAAKQGVAEGVISASDEAQFEMFLVKASTAGMTLNQAIRANQSAPTVAVQVNTFLEAFNQLNISGVAGIKNPKLQLAISTILTGAEASVAVIAASVGGGQ